MDSVVDTEGNAMEIVSDAPPINIVFDVQEIILQPSKCYVCSIMVAAEDYRLGYIHHPNKGGIDELDNMKPLCSGCLEEMGNQNLYTYALTVSSRKRGQAFADAQSYFHTNPHHIGDKRTLD